MKNYAYLSSTSLPSFSNQSLFATWVQFQCLFLPFRQVWIMFSLGTYGKQKYLQLLPGTQTRKGHTDLQCRPPAPILTCSCQDQFHDFCELEHSGSDGPWPLSYWLFPLLLELQAGAKELAAFRLQVAEKAQLGSKAKLRRG